MSNIFGLNVAVTSSEYGYFIYNLLQINYGLYEQMEPNLLEFASKGDETNTFKVHAILLWTMHDGSK